MVYKGVSFIQTGHVDRGLSAGVFHSYSGVFYFEREGVFPF